MSKINLALPSGVKSREALKKVFLTVKDVAELMGTSPASVYKMLHKGYLPFVKYGGRSLVPVPAFEAFLASKTQSAIETWQRTVEGCPDAE